LARGDQIELDELLLTNLATASESQMEFGSLTQRYRAESLADVERRHILATLQATQWNKSRSSQILGIERSTLDRKIDKYRIRRSEGAPETNGD
jgi:Nif-specific regulatory protein